VVPAKNYIIILHAFLTSLMLDVYMDENSLNIICMGWMDGRMRMTSCSLRAAPPLLVWLVLIYASIID